MLLLQQNLQAAAADVSVSSATTDGSDLTAAQASSVVAASSATVDNADISAGNASVTVASSAASTDGQDVTAASVTVVVAGVGVSSATTDGADTTASSVGVSVSASSASADGADITAASVGASVSASSVTTNGADISAGQASPTVSATSATSDGQDTTAASAAPRVTASSATADGQDVTAAQAEAAPVEVTPAGGGMGFEWRYARSARPPLVLRVLAERASRKRAQSYPSRKPAKKIEQQAAELALDDGSQSQFNSLLQRWKALSPPAQAMPDPDAEALFFAHVAERIQQLQAERDQLDEDDAVLALLMT